MPSHSVSSKEFISATAWFKNFKDEIFNKNKRSDKMISAIFLYLLSDHIEDYED